MMIYEVFMLKNQIVVIIIIINFRNSFIIIKASIVIKINFKLEHF
jgi:hypothetical protein